MADKFFTIPAGTHPTVKAIAASMQKQNTTLKFTAQLIKNAGYPLWDKAKVYGNTTTLHTEGEEEPKDTTIVYVPFSLANSTSAIMTVAINLFIDRDTAYNILYPQQYKQYGFDTTLPRNAWNSRNLFALFFDFETEIHGTDSMYVFDGRIFGHDEEDTLVIKRKQVGLGGGQGRMMTDFWDMNCEVYLIGGECPPSQDGFVTNIVPGQGGCLLGDITICNAIWVQTGPSSGGWDAGDASPFAYPTGSGGGGSSTGLEDLPNIPMCPVAARMVTNAPGGIIINPCDPPWIPITPINTYNPYYYDTIGISNALEIAYPCASAFINDSLTNANLLAQLAGGEVFKDSLYMHLFFDTSTTNTTMEAKSGVTTIPEYPNGVWIGPDGFTRFRAKIELNGWYLRNGTKEYMITAIIHEIMHAAFTLRWKQYQSWLTSGQGSIDSAWIKNHYPIYWENYVVNGAPIGEIDDHQIMGTDYFEIFKSAVQYYWNRESSIPLRDSVIKALCYAGLHKTTAWRMLPSTQGIDTCKYKAIQTAAERSANGVITPDGCSSSYTYHYADSLKLRPGCN